LGPCGRTAALSFSVQTFINDPTGIIEVTANGATATLNATAFTDNGLRRTSNAGQIILNP